MRARVVGFALLVACVPREDAHFPLRAAMWTDTDVAPVNVRCHASPTPRDPKHVSCAPMPYQSPLYWDGADNLFFRPLSEALGVATVHEAVNVNSLDEVPDSAWFTNRIGAHPLDDQAMQLGGCAPPQILDPDHAADGSWIIDKGKADGSTPGFRISVPGKGKYLVKADSVDDSPEREAASTVIGSAVYHAAGFNTSCEQIVYVRPSTFKLLPGLRSKANFADEKPFDRAALEAIFAHSPRRDGKLRFTASAWLPGFLLGAFRYAGTREDDPNDVIDHENRRELRGARVLASWIDRFDAREGNSVDSWHVDRKGAPPDASPGHVVHYQLDTSETLGSLWADDAISRRLGYSYIVDWGDMFFDYVTLGAPTHAWDTIAKHPTFGYFDVEHFDAGAWKNEYPNAAFSHMTERDGAWMARILARFTPSNVHALAASGNFTDPANTAYLERTLVGRLDKILQRYLTRLSPLADVRVDAEELVALDLAEARALRDPKAFHYEAHVAGGGRLGVRRLGGGKIAIALSHGSARYLRVIVTDGVARAPLVVHLYDLGHDGFRLAGLERPSGAP
ncbi:MAG TPA: hypothetical protein VGH28_01415 [Polyangiaceae bacterium]|jgi:hypothetical protein